VKTFRRVVRDYLERLGTELRNPQATDELALHYVLRQLLEATAQELDISVALTHEPRRTAHGRPDFIVHRDGLPVGYVEAEPISANLDNLTGRAKEQNERFIANLDNFLLTNFWHFRLYREGKPVAEAQLPKPLASQRLTDDSVTQLWDLLHAFFTWRGLSIGTAEELAVHLARRACQLRNETLNALRDDSNELVEFLRAFQEVLLPNLTPEEFADMFAQTVTYGLFAARCEQPDSAQPFTRSLAADLIPPTNPFLRRLFQRIAAHDLDERIAWVADDIAQLLRQADMAAILQDFGRKFSREDPVVHFYETFLAKYDPQLREVRGVYYTPDPVVNYIVRSVDCLLRRHFEMPDGLADKRALVLDPACGTGTFLAWVIRLVYEFVTQKLGKGSWQAYVRERLLTRIFGFELLVAPYAIAHLKLGLLLRETGYKFAKDERLGIYLTNTLEEAVKRAELLLASFITEEAEAAAIIKREKPILVVLGNPPYSGHSANCSWKIENGRRVPTWIGRLLEDYRRVDGQRLRERNPKWLQDDYVKFIRFAQWRIEQTGKGIIGFITNHAWLDNPTFRGMRWHLLQRFSEIYILNLHGNTRRRERAPDGSDDENVFDIQQGVAILLAVKRPNQNQPCRVFYADLWGKREDKYAFLAERDVDTTEWKQITPTPPLYLFVPQDTALQVEYEQGVSVADIFEVQSAGIVTARDCLTIHSTCKEVWEAVTRFVALRPEEAREAFNLGRDAQDWRVDWAQEDLRQAGVPDKRARRFIVPILYRPFDIRYTFYTGRSRGFHCRPRHEVMRHMLAGENWALITSRQQSQHEMEWALVFVSKFITESCAVSNKTREIGYVFPLYCYPQEGRLSMVERRPNLKREFLRALAERLNLCQIEPLGLPEGISPEDIFGYLYALLHSRQYRERYAEFLRRDFPRIPLTRDLELFRDLAKLGRQLVAVHLLECVPDAGYGKFEVEGDNRVERVRYDEVTRRVFINATQFFAPVPLEVWEFQIGAYQPARKWLEDRRGRCLSLSDLEHYRKILSAIAETLRLMDAIDERLTFPLS